MKTWRKPLYYSFLLFALSSMFFACKKEAGFSSGNNQPGKTSLSVFLTDGPSDFQQVLIDIQQIAVKVDTCRRQGDDDHDGPGCDNDHDSMNSHCEYWDTLDINPGVYDLMILRNGVDTLLASGFLINGKIERIKLTLGNNNQIMVDSVLYPLLLKNNQNFAYVNIHREHLDSLSSNNFQLYLDFDLSRSVMFINGAYILKPYLKPFANHNTGIIEGKVRPVHSFGIIKAYNVTDTGYARPWDEGEFKIRGLDDGIYNLYIDGINGYQDTTLNNINVTRGRKTDLGLIELHQ